MATSLADLGMLCNVLACFATSSACFARSLANLGMLLQGPRSSTSKRNPPTCCLISYEAKGVVYHQVSIYGSLVVHYSLGFIAYKAASGGVSPRCGTPMTLQKHAEDVAKHAKVGRGRCQACLGVAKQAYTSYVPTLIFKSMEIIFKTYGNYI